MQTADIKAKAGVPNLRTLRLASLIEISVVLGAGLGVILIATAFLGKTPVTSIAAVWAANTLMLGLIYLGLRKRGQGWSDIGLDMQLESWRSIPRVFVQSLPVFAVAIGAFVVGAILMANLVGMPERADMSKYDYLRGNLTMTLLALLSVYFVSSLAEEIIYRGYMITRLTEGAAAGVTSRIIAIIVSSLLFGLVHSDWGAAGMVQASFMGVALGTSYLMVKRNLWVTVLAHGYMDTILVLQMYVGS